MKLLVEGEGEIFFGCEFGEGGWLGVERGRRGEGSGFKGFL